MWMYFIAQVQYLYRAKSYVYMLISLLRVTPNDDSVFSPFVRLGRDMSPVCEMERARYWNIPELVPVTKNQVQQGMSRYIGYYST